MISDTKIDGTFPSIQFSVVGYTPYYILDQNCNGGGILLYNPGDITSKLIKIYRFAEHLFVERKFMKRLLCGPYNPIRASFQIILRLLVNVLLFDQV